jgi:hypothetical protein
MPSNLLQPRDDSRYNWQHINRANDTAADALRGLGAHRADVARGRLRPPDITFPFHPFRIYQLPPLWRTTPDDGTNWLKFRVRGGSILIDKASATVATGTDGCADPDGPTYPDVADISATVNVAKYWFWLELSVVAGALAAVVKSAADPTTNGWTAWPAFDGLHLTIGYVDTTATDTKIPVIRQYLRSDVYLPGLAMTLCINGARHTFSVPAAGPIT